MTKNTKTNFLIIGLITVVILLLVIFLIFSRKNVQQTPPVVIYSNVDNNNQLLNEQEKQYSEAPPQSFATETLTENGVLIVTANTNNIRVVIDEPEADVKIEAKPAIIITETPFKISKIPSGKHTLTAYKQSYLLYSTSFNIVDNQITRLYVELSPLKQ